MVPTLVESVESLSCRFKWWNYHKKVKPNCL